MRLSAEGLAFLKHCEGFSSKAYPDADGHSIGYGTFLDTPEMIAKYLHAEIGEAEASQLMMAKVAKIEQKIDKSVVVPISQNQFDALVAFAYNVGTGQEGFGGSTLLRYVNRGKFGDAAREFARWNKSRGKIVPALINRREAE